MLIWILIMTITCRHICPPPNVFLNPAVQWFNPCASLEATAPETAFWIGNLSKKGSSYSLIQWCSAGELPVWAAEFAPTSEAQLRYRLYDQPEQEWMANCSLKKNSPFSVSSIPAHKAVVTTGELQVEGPEKVPSATLLWPAGWKAVVLGVSPEALEFLGVLHFSWAKKVPWLSSCGGLCQLEASQVCISWTSCLPCKGVCRQAMDVFLPMISRVCPARKCRWLLSIFRVQGWQIKCRIWGMIKLKH